MVGFYSAAGKHATSFQPLGSPSAGAPPHAGPSGCPAEHPKPFSITSFQVVQVMRTPMQTFALHQ
jgi:hypothetical protein